MDVREHLLSEPHVNILVFLCVIPLIGVVSTFVTLSTLNNYDSVDVNGENLSN